MSDGRIPRRRPKRADLSTLELLSAIHKHGIYAWEVLMCRWPPKIIEAALIREDERGYTNYGVAAHRCWLEPKGEEALRHLVNQAATDIPVNPA